MEIFWKKLLENYLHFHEVIILYGNIHDRFPANEVGQYNTLSEVIKEILTKMGYKNINEINNVNIIQNERPIPTDEVGQYNTLSEIIKEILTKMGYKNINEINNINITHNEQPTGWILHNMASVFSELREWTESIWKRHEELLTKIQESNNRHRFIMIFPDEGRIPGNFLVNLPGIKRLFIPFPDFNERWQWIKEIIINSSIPFTCNQEDDQEEILKRFIAMTQGLHWRDLQIIVTDIIQKKKDPILTIRQFKFGQSRDYWGEILNRKGKDSLANAEEQFLKGSDPILGQDESVRKAVNTVRRACLNLSNIFAPAYNRPKGILFLVGPTGVGKTMLAKKLAKFIFGDESNCIVFDMREYSQSHSESRLIGAPLGYVGYDEGGQLTTALQRQPFSVVVFDEIDKAHPTILTKFLQILDEGRLTDGKGQSCYFSESLIIFTSNAGAEELIENPDVPFSSKYTEPNGYIEYEYSELQRYYQNVLEQKAEGLKDHPEILNRIGLLNIIPFRHITTDRYVKESIKKLLDKTVAHFETELDMLLIIRDEKELITYLAKCARWKEYGMRNIKQIFESELLDKIAEVKSIDIFSNIPLLVKMENGSIVIEFEQ